VSAPYAPTESEKQRIERHVRAAYKGALAVRIRPGCVEVKLPLRFDKDRRPLLVGWFEASTPEYWLALALDPASQLAPGVLRYPVM
jgi:hypothetical protein